MSLLGRQNLRKSH